MIICICNPITSEEITKSIPSQSSLKDLIKTLNICNTCGSCSKEIKCLWDDFNSSRLV